VYNDASSKVSRKKEIKVFSLKLTISGAAYWQNSATLSNHGVNHATEQQSDCKFLILQFSLSSSA
jgi:hypothetical protein